MGKKRVQELFLTFHRHSPDSAFDRPEVGLVAKVRPQSSVPVTANLVLEIPPLDLVDAYAWCMDYSKSQGNVILSEPLWYWE